jgi:mono/diheme cytochrome c family protein
MTFFEDRISLRIRARLFALIPISLLFVLLLFFPPNGQKHSQFGQFVGRFHLLVIHFPIALVLITPLFELAGRSRYFPGLLNSVDFLQGLATFSAIVAAILGWCLAWNGGYSGYLVIQHMWGGAWLAFGCLLCWTLRGLRNAGAIYTLMLAVIVGLVLWTGYRGGQLSQGENHLTEFMPGSLRWLLRASDRNDEDGASRNPGPDTLYGGHIQPLFNQHCISCHGPDKQKSNLRLDSLSGVIRGGKHGEVVKGGDTKDSELFRRITLPPDHNDFMPAEHKRPLNEAQVKLIGFWIGTGASATQLAEAAKDLAFDAQASSDPVAEVGFTEIDAAAVATERAPLSSAVSDWQERFPGTLNYVSRGSADLDLNLSLLGSQVTDEDLSTLQPLVEYIELADFSSTAITDRSAPTIATMKRLRVLSLMRTQISDASVQALGGLNQLEFLTLFGTEVTTAVFPVLEQLPKLRHVYVGETKIAAGAPLPEGVKEKIEF